MEEFSGRKVSIGRVEKAIGGEEEVGAEGDGEEKVGQAGFGLLHGCKEWGEDQDREKKAVG